MQPSLHETTQSETQEACARCKEPTQTELPPRWVRWCALGVAGGLAGLPLLSPLLAADPMFAFIAYVSVGVAFGPAIAVLFARGGCRECKLERPGRAIRRMGLCRYLLLSYEN